MLCAGLNTAYGDEDMRELQASEVENVSGGYRPYILSGDATYSGFDSGGGSYSNGWGSGGSAFGVQEEPPAPPPDEEEPQPDDDERREAIERALEDYLRDETGADWHCEMTGEGIADCTRVEDQQPGNAMT